LDLKEKKAKYKEIIKVITQTFDSSAFIDVSEIYMAVVAELATIPYFDWTGIYLLDAKKQELNLDNYISGRKNR
jgi:putative methionine-R-sulfoxide reductase with GAF domain